MVPIGRRTRSVISGWWVASGMVRIFSRISGANRSMPMTWVTRARVMPSLRAISAWVAILPESNRSRHSMALRRSSTTLGILGSLCGFPRGGGTALTTRPAATQRVSAPMLPFSNAPLAPEGDLDRLFAVGRHGGATVGNLCEMDDPEPNFGLHLAVSTPAHLGSQCNSIRTVEGSAICVMPRWLEISE